MPLAMTEGFHDLADTVEALREMREAQGGGVLATAEEQRELEAALVEDEAVAAPAPAVAGVGDVEVVVTGGDGSSRSQAMEITELAS